MIIKQNQMRNKKEYIKLIVNDSKLPFTELIIKKYDIQFIADNVIYLKEDKHIKLSHWEIFGKIENVENIESVKKELLSGD